MALAVPSPQPSGSFNSVSLSPGGVIPDWVKLGYRSEDDYRLDNGLSTADGRQDTMDLSNPNGGSTKRYNLDQQLVSQPGSGTGVSFKQYFNGTLYTDENAYKDAVLQDAQTKYAKNRSQLESAYKAGLITFDEQQALLKQNRDNILKQKNDLGITFANDLRAINNARTAGLQNNAGFFAAVSPDAAQSQQGVLEEKINTQADTGVSEATRVNENNTTVLDQALGRIGSLDFSNPEAANEATATGALIRDRKAYDTGYANNLDAIESAKTQASDAVNQGVIDFQSRRAQAAATANANTAKYDPTDVLKGLAGLYIQNQKFGLNDEQNKINIANALAKTKISTEEQNNLLGYLYGSFLPQVTPFINQ